MSGWIKVHRQLLDKPIWRQSTPEQKAILITLLLMANHDANEWEWGGAEFAVEPGQFVTSLNSIAERAGKGISIQNVRTALVRFEKLDFLTNQSTKHGRLITIVNWGLYQSKDDTPNKPTNKGLTKDSQRPNKALTPNKNDKNERMKEEDISSSQKPAPMFDESSQEYKLAIRLRERILGNLPNARVPKPTPDGMASWCRQIDYILRLDNREPEDVALVIDWCQKDDFWRANILSPQKLREKWDTLVLQMERGRIYLASKKRREAEDDPYAAYNRF